jgi:hypothetical protein
MSVIRLTVFDKNIRNKMRTGKGTSHLENHNVKDTGLHWKIKLGHLTEKGKGSVVYISVAQNRI